jgi:NTP pyrophosphatase (non-canonical NTP hydrolase)
VPRQLPGQADVALSLNGYHDSYNSYLVEESSTSINFSYGEKMNFSEYQTKSRKTAGYPAIGNPVIYPVLGLVNEAGEVAGKIKKVFRDKDGQISEETREALKAELGDVLWYIAQVATELDLSLDDIAEHNIAKLYDRLERGKIRGDGDNR